MVLAVELAHPVLGIGVVSEGFLLSILGALGGIGQVGIALS